MIWRWLKRRQRRKITAVPFPASWREHLDRNVEHYGLLSASEGERLEATVQVLVAEKHWEGCGGLELNDEIIVTLAAQAALLLLGLEHDYYRNVLSVLVYPGDYRIERQRANGSVVTDESLGVQGTAELRGPVILSWRSARHGGRDARDGRNVVYHEFAHKLDMLDGLVDGTPPLDCSAELAEWVRVMTPAYEQLCADADRGRRTLLDPYGATNVGEFFAVATEIFFEKPVQLHRRHPSLYELLASFYGQDTAARLGTRRQRRR